MCEAQDDHLGARDVIRRTARYCRVDFDLMCEQVARVRLFRRLAQMPPLSAQARRFRRYISRRDASIAEREARIARDEEAYLQESMSKKDRATANSADEKVALPPGEPSVPARHVIVHECNIDPLKISATSSDRSVVRDRMRVELSSPKKIAGPKDRDQVDILFSQVFAESSWMPPPLEFLWQSAIDSITDGRGFQMAPVILVGPPGCGKTHTAMRIAEVAGIASSRLEGSTMAGSFAVGGSDFQWAGAHPGEPVKRIHESGVANPIMIFDEAEKAATGGTGGDPRAALLPLLQRSTAASYRCPYLQATVDLSRVSWILCVNSLEGLPAPLLDRVTAFEIGYPRGIDLVRLVIRVFDDLDVDERVIARVVQEIEDGKLTLRALDRIKARFRAIARQPMLN